MKNLNGLYITLYTKKNAMLLATVLLLGTFSCRKSIDQVYEQPARSNQLMYSTSLSPNLIFEETFEDGNAFSSGSYANLQVGTSYGFTTSTSHVFEGAHAGRFELHDTDPEVSSGTRAEAKFPIQDNLNRWYSYSVYFPSTEWQYDSKAEIINQWHQGGGVSPSISLITRYDKMVIETRTVPDSKTQYPLGAIVKDKWQTYVLHIIHSHGSDGLIEIWRDGVKIFTHQGANSYDFSSFEHPKWKLGIYKWEWNGTKTTDVNKRIIFFDNVRLGNEKANYSNMVTGGKLPLITDTTTTTSGGTNTTTPTTTTSALSVNSFSLVNAGTEQTVLTITDGMTISLSKYSLKKVNIKALPSSGTASVKFVLSGQQSKTSVDNASPYALMGDDGSGNFYYGNWDPPAVGSYTLTATPYDADGATGTAGTTAKIHFTIAK